MELLKQLNKTQTEQFFINTNYKTMVVNWKQACKDGVELTVADNLLYTIMRGKSLFKAFRPLSSTKALLRGCGEYQSYTNAYYMIVYGKYNKHIFGDVNIKSIQACVPSGGDIDDQNALYYIIGWNNASK